MTGIDVVVELAGVEVVVVVVEAGVVVDEIGGTELVTVEVGFVELVVVVEDGVVEVGEHPAITRARARTRMPVTEYIFPKRESVPDNFIVSPVT
jgi:hypothetical protein